MVEDLILNDSCGTKKGKTIEFPFEDYINIVCESLNKIGQMWL